MFFIAFVIGIWQIHPIRSLLLENFRAHGILLSNIDVLGINAYGTLSNVDSAVKGSFFKGPYIVTEWGPDGWWEAKTTLWNAPIEPASAEKSAVFAKNYNTITNQRDLCLGSYVFLWGCKEERTPTWYGMFLENNTESGLSGESCPTVDVMQKCWTGDWPSNRAPEVTGITINGLTAQSNVVMTNHISFTAVVAATDPEGDTLHYTWEILKEATVFAFGGDYEPRPDRVGTVLNNTESSAVLTVNNLGIYRLYVYVFDGKGHVGTANIPFQVW